MAIHTHCSIPIPIGSGCFRCTNNIEVINKYATETIAFIKNGTIQGFPDDTCLSIMILFLIFIGIHLYPSAPAMS